MSVLPLGMGGLALISAIGWALSLPRLKSVLTDGSTMKPNTTLALAAFAISLVFVARPLISRAAASLTAFIGVTTLISSAFGWTAIDHLAHWTQATETIHMSPATATCLSALGLGRLLAERAPRIAQGFAVIALLIAGAGMVAFSYGLSSLRDVAFMTTMALHTSIAITLGGAGLLAITQQGPLTRVFVGTGARASMARKLALVSVFAPWTVGLIVLALVDRAAMSAAFALAIVVVATTALQLASVWGFTSELGKRDDDLGITLDSIGDGVLIADANGRVQRLNPVAEKLTGWSLDDARGRHVEEVFNILSEDTRQKTESPVVEVLRSGTVVGLANHTLLVDRSGRERPIADSGAPVRAADGTMRGVVLVFRDMTAEAEARHQLERVVNNLRQLMDATPLGLVASDHGQVVYANPAALALFAEKSETFVGKQLIDFIEPEDAALTVRRQAEWTAGTRLPPRRVRLRTTNGSVLVDSHPLAAQIEFDGKPVRLAAIERAADRDGLELRLARQSAFGESTAEFSRQLNEARFELPTILSTAVRIAAPGQREVGMVKLATEQLEWLGEGVATYARDAELLANAQKFIPPTPTGLTTPVLKEGRLLRITGEDIARHATPEVRALLGTNVPAHVAAVPMRTAGRVVGALIIARFEPRPFDDDDVRFLQDIADRSAQAVLNAQLWEDMAQTLDAKAKTEAQLRHSQKLEALGQLAGGIAHDFNNLLSVILSLSEFLIEKTHDEELRNDLSDVKAAGERAAELTKQLLAFSRKQVMQLKSLDLNLTVRSLERMLTRLLSEDIKLHFEGNPTLPLVRADTSLITQVVMNLVVNARDAMPRGGQLQLRTRVSNSPPGELPAGKYVCLDVIDQGCGISAEVREHLFEPFFTTKARGKGTGLGLSTSYGIARQSGGTLSVESVEGKGATFTLWLPELKTEKDSLPAVASGTRTAKSSGIIFLVEDEPRVRETARRVLERAGFTVHAVGSSEEALKTEPTMGPVDLLLTDVVMPGKSGRELADAMMLRRPELPVLFMSGYTEDAVVQRGVHDGQVALLQKPFTPDSLLSAVRDAIANE